MVAPNLCAKCSIWPCACQRSRYDADRDRELSILEDWRERPWGVRRKAEDKPTTRARGAVRAEPK
jgi:hypothetical protein